MIKKPYTCVIITPNASIAHEINRCYNDEGVKAFAAGSHWQGRAKKVVVMTPPPDMSPEYYKGYEQYARECEARLIYQGELVRL